LKVNSNPILNTVAQENSKMIRQTRKQKLVQKGGTLDMRSVDGEEWGINIHAGGGRAW
jgi:hypothetical protein